VAAALLGCGLPVEVISRHHQGTATADDPVIDYDYDVATGAALPPWPGLRPGSPRLALDALRRPGRRSSIVALSGLLPVGRGTLAPVAGLVGGVAAEAGFAALWPDAPRPWIVAVDYRTGRRVVFGRDSVALGPDRVPRILRGVPLADAVAASCSIPAWYPPRVIDGVPYIDGGTASNASVDLLGDAGVDEVYVLAPMASVLSDQPHGAIARVERSIRRVITRGILADVTQLRADGVQVVLVTPGPEDLPTMGVNLMDPRQRIQVLDTSRRTSAAQIARQLPPEAAPGDSPAGSSKPRRNTGRMTP
jgi:NTE family protein